jgi:hypothetical protein
LVGDGDGVADSEEDGVEEAEEVGAVDWTWSMVSRTIVMQRFKNAENLSETGRDGKKRQVLIQWSSKEW